MLSFDTNILVYAADTRDAARHELARGLLQNAAQVDAGLTEQSLIEFLHVATRKPGRPLQEAAQFVHAWLAIFTLMVPHQSVIADTLDLLTRNKLSAWDARLLAVCSANGCNLLLSEDLQDNAVYEGVHVLNPFNPANADRLEEFFRT